MAENNVKFYRLGFNNPVTLQTYNQYATGNNIVFAKVAEGEGTWDATDNTLSMPTYRIFAGGIHYNVADADALNYVMDQVNTWKGDVSVEGSILNIIANAVNAAHIVSLVDATSSNVSAEVVEVTDSKGNKQEKIKLTAATSTVIKTGSDAPEDAGITNPKNGDYYIQEVAINGSDVPSRTAYIYNGTTSTWQALDGNVTAENVYFPDGLQRTAQFGFQPESIDIQTECEGMNLKDLLEWYLVQEKYPVVKLTQATANAGSYNITLDTPSNITTYIEGPANNSLVEVGTPVKFKGIELTETAGHTGDDNYNGTTAKIEGMKYKYKKDSVDGALVEQTTYMSNIPTTNASYTTNFDTAKVQMALTNAGGFTGITTANTSCGVNNGTAALSEQSGTTAEGTNTLKLSWTNDASVSRTLTDQEGVSAYTAYPLSNKGNASTNVKYTVNATSWSHTAKATAKTYTTTTYTVNAVYPIYTNGVTVTTTYVEADCKWSTNSFNIADTADGATRAVNGEKLALYNYKSNKGTEYYIGAGNQGGVNPLMIYIPASAGITKLTVASYNVNSKDWTGETSVLSKTSNVYINGIQYNVWSGVGPFGPQNILVTFA